ncbi:hypothetical protein GCM10023078_40040 [Gibbsiella greigii]
MLNTIAQIAILVVLVVSVYLILGLYVRGITALSKKILQRRLSSGEMSDKKVTKFYHSYKKKKDQRLVPILIFGIFYKSFVRMQGEFYALYRAEMEKRQLPL